MLGGGACNAMMHGAHGEGCMHLHVKMGVRARARMDGAIGSQLDRPLVVLKGTSYAYIDT
jgi:hypothetical protein